MYVHLSMYLYLSLSVCMYVYFTFWSLLFHHLICYAALVPSRIIWGHRTGLRPLLRGIMKVLLNWNFNSLLFISAINCLGTNHNCFAKVFAGPCQQLIKMAFFFYQKKMVFFSFINDVFQCVRVFSLKWPFFFNQNKILFPVL